MQWEKALQEEKETICMMDVNLDFLTWDMENLPENHSSVKLRKLTQALFDRILPLGMTQLVTGATRAERGVPKTGLDHVYSNRIDKLSPITTEFTGMSDHKIVIVRKFSRDYKRKERYTTKRCFKDFNENKFKMAVKIMPELEDCLLESDVNCAANFLTSGLCRILAVMAPIKTFQLRNNYVPYLSTITKDLQKVAVFAQAKAWETGDQEDFRQYRSLRNQRNGATKRDKLEYETGKLNNVSQDPSACWSMAKKYLAGETQVLLSTYIMKVDTLAVQRSYQQP